MHPTLKCKDLNVLYYKLKARTVLLNADLFKWHIYYTLLCRNCLWISENAQHFLFECNPIVQGSGRLRNYCNQLEILIPFDDLNTCSLSHDLEATIYKLMIMILKICHCCQIPVDCSQLAGIFGIWLESSND